MPAAPINAFLSLLLFVESLWRRRFDSAIGSSLLCLARKPVDTLSSRWHKSPHGLRDTENAPQRHRATENH